MINDQEGRLSKEELMNFFSSMSNFQLTFFIRHNIPTTKFTSFDCYRWIIQADFRMINNGHYSQTNRMDRQFWVNVAPGKIRTDFLTRYLWVLIVSTILSILSLYLNIKYIKDITSSIERVRKELCINSAKKKDRKNTSNDINVRNFLDRAYTSHRVSFPNEEQKDDGHDEEDEDGEMTFNWSDLSLKDKWELFSGWSVVVILGNVMTLIASVYLLASTKTSQREGEIILGMGAFLVIISLMRYYENVKGYNIILNTMIQSAGVFLKATLGSLPIFLGFTVLGNWLFNENERFANFSMSLYMLFSLVNGDVIFQAFLELKEYSFLVGQWFLYIYNI